jgi:P pilus assembly chaperone PapD
MTSCPEVKPVSRTRILSLITIGFLIFLVLCSLPAAGMKVMGTKYTGSIAPGSSAVHVMTVSTNTGDPPMDLRVDVLGLGQSPQQSSLGLAPEKDISPYSARTFINISPKTFHLEPGGSQEVIATITVPNNVGNGGRYAMITIRNAPVGTGSTAIVTSISVPVLVTIDGTAATMTGTITNVTVADVVPGQPIRITTALKNTGNYHYKVTTNVSVADPAGKVVATGGTDLSAGSIIPPFTQEYNTDIVTPLPLGTYTITSTISRDDGTVLDKKTVPFELRETYLAPFQEVTVPLSPRSSAVLKTTDGRFTVTFPAGAVISDGSVTIKPTSRDKLPAAPKGATLGATCFRIDGLTGLLSKDATVQVQYSSADLEAAGGDASKLVLARYDEADNTWTILPTTVDKGSLTLTAITNRFSTWAVMASSGGSTAGSPTGKTGLDVTLVCAALGLVIVFAGRNIRK